MQMSLASVKLEQAVRTLATSSAPIEERLLMTYKQLHPLMEHLEWFATEELKQKYLDIEHRLTSVKDTQSGQPRVSATLAYIRPAEAEAIAALIFDLRDEVEAYRRAHAGHEPSEADARSAEGAQAQ